MNRRDLFPAFGGALLGAGLPIGADAAADGPAAGSKSSLDTLQTHVRMRAHPDGRPAFWWYSGTFYGQVSGQRTVPLLGIEGLSINRCTPADDGAFTYALREAGWFKDLGTGAILDQWLNPLTGRTVAPKHYYSPQSLRFEGATVLPVLKAPIPGLEYTGYLGAPVTLGDSVWSSEELLVRMPGANGAPATVQTSLLTLHASLRDLRARANRFVPSTMAYQTLASWRPWMDMRDIPGVISWRLFGRKAATVDELPPAIVARTRSTHPQLFEG